LFWLIVEKNETNGKLLDAKIVFIWIRCVQCFFKIYDSRVNRPFLCVTAQYSKSIHFKNSGRYQVSCNEVFGHRHVSSVCAL
jgi:hypothetical protein